MTRKHFCQFRKIESFATGQQLAVDRRQQFSSIATIADYFVSAFSGQYRTLPTKPTVTRLKFDRPTSHPTDKDSRHRLRCNPGFTAIVPDKRSNAETEAHANLSSKESAASAPFNLVLGL